MPSFRARLTNRFLRMTTKSLWRPGLDVAAVRVHTARMDARLSRRRVTVPTEAITLGGVPCTWFGEPARAERGTLLYLHGGAWCLHLPGVYGRLAARLSDLTGFRVLLVDYRLAPEHPFPAGIDDCYTVYRQLVDDGYSRRPLALAGDSAGGNLSLVTLMRARDGLLPLPDCAVLISPATDLTFSGPSARYNAEADPMFSPYAAELLPDNYSPGQDRVNPLLSPLFGNWNGLPPLLFHAGSTEMLLDDSVRAHDRARQAGVEADIEVWNELPHVFHVFDWMPEARVGVEAVAHYVVDRTVRRRAAVAEALGPSVAAPMETDGPPPVFAPRALPLGHY